MLGNVIAIFANSVPVNLRMEFCPCDDNRVTAWLDRATVVTPPNMLSIAVKFPLTGKSQVPTSVPLMGIARLVLTVVGSTIFLSSYSFLSCVAIEIARFLAAISNVLGTLPAAIINGFETYF